jgi:cytochrome c-type biogenesis protein CcmH/NrfG
MQRLFDASGDGISAESLRHLVTEARQSADWDMLNKMLEAYLKRHPDDHEFWAEFGFALNMLGDYEAAIVAFDQAIALNPNHVWAHILAANSSRLKGDLSTGLTYAERAVVLDPAQAAAWTALGNIQLSEEHPTDAADSFMQSINLQPDNLDAWHGYARAATGLELPAATDAWPKVLSLNPPDDISAQACEYLGEDENADCER